VSTTIEARRGLIDDEDAGAAVSAPDTPAAGITPAQIEVLRRSVAANPVAFRDVFIGAGASAAAWEFQQPELSEGFTTKLWEILLRRDDSSTLLMRFVWNLPVAKKRAFIRALAAHLSERYPMFAELTNDWPAGNSIPPYIREAEERSSDFGLVNMGYMGYMEIGYSLREVELFVWLEALRDKQCAEAPCELGKLISEHGPRKGGCPVKIHIPLMFNLLGHGRFDEALAMLESCNPLPNVTGRVCPQELQCQGVCIHKHSMTIGQVEWFLPEWDKAANPGGALARLEGTPNPWETATKPPIAIVGSGPSGMISAYLLAAEGYPVTVFEAFHTLGGVLRYGIPEFRLPNELIDDTAAKIRALGGRFVLNFVVGKTATLEQLREAGFARIFVGSGAGLPRFMNVPGEHLLNVMSANEFLTRVNLMRAHEDGYETPLPFVAGKKIMIIGGGNTAMDACRTAKRLGGDVTIVYRRTRAEMPARVEELEHALEEGVKLATLKAPSEFLGNQAGFVTGATIDIMELGEPDASGRRAPISTGQTEFMEADLCIMALGNDANPIIKDSEPRLAVSKWGTINLAGEGTQETSLAGIFTGGDAARGGSTAIRAAGDGQAAAREILAGINVPEGEVATRVASALKYTEAAAARNVILAKREISTGICEFTVYSPVIASSAQAGQFVRVLATPNGELIPLTLADWDTEAGTITLVVQDVGVSSHYMNSMAVGDAFEGIAGPLGRPSIIEKFDETQTMVFAAGGVGLAPSYPIIKQHLAQGNHVTVILGFRSKDLMFWVGEGERVGDLEAKWGSQIEVIYTTNDGSYGIQGFVTTPLEGLLKGESTRTIGEITTIGPAVMMRAVSDQSKPFGVHTMASLNAIMVDATGMCGACMVPVEIEGKIVRRHACIDGPDIDAHIIDWDKFLPRFNIFKAQEAAANAAHA
jgi:glutamate synthase (NADPH/NADH) small chain